MVDAELSPVKFNAHVEPPFSEEPPDEKPPLTPEKPKIPLHECCDSTPLSYHSTDPLVEALPIILVGVGVAWIVGVATGAWIFSIPSSE